MLAAVAWGGLRLLDGLRVEADWAARGIAVKDGTAASIVQLAHRDSRAQAIVDAPEAYPPEYLDLLARNSETLEFVLGYPAHHGDAPGQSLTEPLDTMPLLLQWDMRWGYQPYGESTVAVSGCAPACLSMAAAYLTGDPTLTPYRVAQFAAEQGYYVPGAGDKLVAAERGRALAGRTVPPAYARPGAGRRCAGRGPSGDLLYAAGRFYDRGTLYCAVRPRGWRVYGPRSEQRGAERKGMVL